MDKNSKKYQKYLAYLKSNEWYSLKLDLLQKRGCKCQKCKRELAPNKLQVHHITYANLYKEHSTDLLLLCGKCHKHEHGLDKPKKKVSKKSASKKAHLLQNKKAKENRKVELEKKKFPYSKKNEKARLYAKLHPLNIKYSKKVK